MVCDDMETPGSLAQTGLTQKLIVQNVSIYEIIMRAYTQAHQQNRSKQKSGGKKGYLNVEEMGKVVCSIEITRIIILPAPTIKRALLTWLIKVRIYDGEGKTRE